MTVALAILAAGAARRLGIDKVLADLGGHPVLAWSLAAATASGVFDDIVVVTSKDRLSAAARIAGSRARVVLGGESRTASSWAALDAAPDADVIAIHDAARPFAAPSLFAKTVEIARAEGTAVTGLPVADTLRRANEIGDASGEMDREGLWSAQTPQTFQRALLAKARDAALPNDSFGDDAAALIAAGMKVRMVPGDRRNFKLTTFEDLAYARELVRSGAVAIAAVPLESKK